MPVLEHEIHSSVRQNAVALYGCYNRGDFADGYWGQNGWTKDGRRKVIWIEHFTDSDCKVDTSDNDAKCKGCSRQGDGAFNSARIEKLGS